MKNAFIILALLFCVITDLSAQTKKQTGKSKSITADTTLANEYFNLSDKYNVEFKLDSSNIFLIKASKIYSKWQMYNKCCDCYNKMGVNFLRQFQNDSAYYWLSKSLELAISELGGNNLFEAKNYMHLAIYYRNTGNFQESIKYHNKSLNLKVKLLGYNNIEVAKSYNNVAVVYLDIQIFDKALDYLTQALKIRKTILDENHPDIAANYLNLGIIYSKKGYYDKANQLFHKSLPIFLLVNGEQNPDVAMCYNNIGVCLYNSSDLDGAAEYYNKALNIRLNIFNDYHPDVAASYKNLASVYTQKGNCNEAVIYLTKALEIEKYLYNENHPNVLTTKVNLVPALSDCGDIQTANNYCYDILKSCDITGDSISDLVATVYSNLGTTYFNNKLYDSSSYFIEKGANIYKKLSSKNNPLFNEMMLESSINHIEKKDYLTAINIIQDVLLNLNGSSFDTNIYFNPNINNINSENETLKALKLKALSFFKIYQYNSTLSDLQASLSTYELASELIDKIRRGYKAEGSKLFLGKKAAEIYENAIQVALTMHEVTKDNQYKDKAFFFAEKNRSNVLLDAMADSRAKSFGDIPDSLLEQEKNMKIDLSFYDTQIQKEQEKGKDADSAKIADYQDKLFDFNRRYQSLIDTLEKHYPRYYELKYQTSVASVSDIQKNIDDKTALIEYFTGDGNLYIFTITKNAHHVYSTRKDTSFNSLVKRFYASIRKSDRTDYAATNYELYKKLILPVEKHINKKEKWVIIPDGPLYYAPFEAMTVKPSKSNDYAALPYLIKDRDIRYHYSATLWNRDSGNKPVHQYEFAGFAPVFSDTVKNGYMIGSNVSVLDTMNPSVAYRSVERGSNAFRALPQSENELTAIVRAFESRKKNAVGYLHRDASEENFKARAALAKILHIATHGMINEKKPKLSALAFSQPQDSLAKEDGLLYAGEIYNLKTSADLVVLSSCESGLGEVVRGEGMMALTRGFIYAGADHIVTSLWRVLDDNAHTLMTSMYAEMLSGRSYSESLRRTKCAMIKNPKTNAPSQWSAFVLFGK